MSLLKKCTDEEEHEPVQKVVLYRLENNKVQTIEIGSIGAIDSDIRNSNGYYMVGLESSPYTLQGNKTIYGQVIESGELIANIGYFSTDISYSICYVTPRYGNVKTIISPRTAIKRDTLVSKPISSRKYVHV